MTGIENQILACLRRPDCAAAADVAQRIGVSPEFVQSVLDLLEKEERIAKTGSAGYTLSPSQKGRSERYRRLEARRKPFVRW
jgi:predicted ArsR family transcriptional regulator